MAPDNPEPLRDISSIGLKTVIAELSRCNTTCLDHICNAIATNLGKIILAVSLNDIFIT